MPSRWLHDSLLSSARWNDLGHAAQCFYIRLMLVTDDFGAFDGRESVVAAACYPTQRVDVSELLAALQAADLIVRYSNAGKPYIALMRWQNDLRGKRRFPAPPVNNDAPDLKLQGKYGRPIGWRNPGGIQVASLLLDQQMRPVVPQPPEWRLVDKDYAPALDGVQALATMVDKPYAPLVHRQGPPAVALAVASALTEQQQTATAVDPPAPQHGAQALATTAPPTNGKVELNDNGEWTGVRDDQRARWQEMFSEMSVPDQLERAGAWLVAHPKDRALYTERGELEQFLIRWLLTEARQNAERTARAKATADSQGKR